VSHQLPENVFVERVFWAAAGLAVVGAVGPLLVTIGHTNRIASVFFPFAAAALAMGALALFYQQGKTLAALVYFLAGLAIAYGMLQLLSVPMRLAVLGSCPPAPQHCNAGLELQLSAAESTGLTVAVAFGLMALFTGFAGLAALYRQRAPAPPPAVWPDQPPPKPEPQRVGEKEPEPEPVPEPVAAPVAAAPPRPPRKRRPKRATIPPAEESLEPPVEPPSE
jgi:hypothetical protein